MSGANGEDVHSGAAFGHAGGASGAALIDHYVLYSYSKRSYKPLFAYYSH